MDIGFGRCGARLGRKVGKGGSLSVDECQGQSGAAATGVNHPPGQR